MWWSIKKIEENDTEVTYSYGYESDALTGSFSVARNLSLVHVLEYAQKDTPNLFEHLFLSILIGFLSRNGFVDFKQIAIG